MLLGASQCFACGISRIAVSLSIPAGFACWGKHHWPPSVYHQRSPWGHSMPSYSSHSNYSWAMGIREQVGASFFERNACLEWPSANRVLHSKVVFSTLFVSLGIGSLSIPDNIITLAFLCCRIQTGRWSANRLAITSASTTCFSSSNCSPLIRELGNTEDLTRFCNHGTHGGLNYCGCYKFWNQPSRRSFCQMRGKHSPNQTNSGSPSKWTKSTR